MFECQAFDVLRLMQWYVYCNYNYELNFSTHKAGDCVE
jgi:hypothetical protein